MVLISAQIFGYFKPQMGSWLSILAAVLLLHCVELMQNADASVDECLSCADYSPTYKIVLKTEAESATGPVCE